MIRGRGPKKPKQQRKNDRASLPFQRVSAEIQVDSTREIAQSRVFLNDLSHSGVGCFVDKPITKGETVTLVISQPKHLFIKGQVIWCTPYTLNVRIISSENFKYRIGIKFNFESQEERDAFYRFCAEMMSQLKAA